MFHRESDREELLLAIQLIGVFDFLEFKGKSLLPILTLQRPGGGNPTEQTPKASLHGEPDEGKTPPHSLKHLLIVWLCLWPMHQGTLWIPSHPSADF